MKLHLVPVTGKLVLNQKRLNSTDGNTRAVRGALGAVALFVTMLLLSAAAQAADVNISNPQYPFTPAADIGWNPGMTHARAIHWAYDGRATNYGWYRYWDSCPDDGDCSAVSVLDDQYQADFDIAGSITPCRPNSNEPTTVDGWSGLTCPLYSCWFGPFGNNNPKSFGAAVNNYSWNRWNSPNIWIGIEENYDRSATLRADPPFNYRRLDNALLSLTLNAYLDRNYVENGRAPRGQGRITIGFKFIPANAVLLPDGTWDRVVVVEMNMSNMRVNMDDQRLTDDYPVAPGAPRIPVSNPWRDDIWAEYIFDRPLSQDPHPRKEGRHTYVIGARNWGFNLVEGQPQTVFLDPWWVATTLVWPPSECPEPLNDNGTQGTSSFDPGGYGVVPCGEQASKYALPYEALFDANGQPAAQFLGFYVGEEMAGSAVHGDTNISSWTIKERW
jgi:hypothetical protein